MMEVSKTSLIVHRRTTSHKALCDNIICEADTLLSGLNKLLDIVNSLGEDVNNVPKFNGRGEGLALQGDRHTHQG